MNEKILPVRAAEERQLSIEVLRTRNTKRSVDRTTVLGMDGSGTALSVECTPRMSFNVQSSDEWASQLNAESFRLFRAASKSPIVTSAPLHDKEVERNAKSGGTLSWDMHRPNVRVDDVQCVWNVDATALFVMRNHNSIGAPITEVGTTFSLGTQSGIESPFLSRNPFQGALSYGGQSGEEHKDCPRCSRVCYRELTISDAVVCAWCYYAGNQQDNCWFCWQCRTCTGSDGEADGHFFMWDCVSTQDFHI